VRALHARADHVLDLARWPDGISTLEELDARSTPSVVLRALAGDRPTNTRRRQKKKHDDDG
jgi:hypothetical protein